MIEVDKSQSVKEIQKIVDRWGSCVRSNPVTISDKFGLFGCEIITEEGKCRRDAWYAILSIREIEKHQDASHDELEKMICNYDVGTMVCTGCANQFGYKV